MIIVTHRNENQADHCGVPSSLLLYLRYEGFCTSMTFIDCCSATDLSQTYDSNCSED